MKSKKKNIILIIVAVILVIVIGLVIYFMPMIKFVAKGGSEIPQQELDSATQDYLAIIESMNAQTGNPDGSNGDNSSADSKSDNGNNADPDNSHENVSSNGSDLSSSAENSVNSDNSSPDNQDSFDNQDNNNGSDDNNNNGGDNNNNNNNQSANSDNGNSQAPAETVPSRDYSQFIGTWKGYFGTEMSPTYELFNDLGFELISTNGSEITYTFWLTCNGISKKLANTYGKIDDNGRLNIVINGEQAKLTLDLVFEEDGSLWGVVTNASILNNPITFPVLFFQK